MAAASLSKRYGMDFRRAADRYGALSDRPRTWPGSSASFTMPGVRHVIVDLVGPYERRLEQLERFAGEVMPLLAGLR